MNILRINHLFRAYFIENKKRLLIMAVIVFAAAILESIDGLLEVSPVVFSGVLIVTAVMFFQSSLKRNNSAHFFNLPVTAGEKLFNAIAVLIMLVMVFHIILIAGTYAGYYLIRPVFNSNVNRLVTDGMSILELSIWHSEGYFLFAAAISVFLFGSVYFKKHALIKTLAVGAGFSLIFIPLYNLLLFFIAFGTSDPFAGEEYSFATTSKVTLLNVSFYEEYTYISSIITALFFLSLTLLRLKETEV